MICARVTINLAGAKGRVEEMHPTCFDMDTSTYEVMEGGGTIEGGDHRGARKFKVVISQNTCNCGVPQRMHIPCAHMVTACRHHGVDFEGPTMDMDCIGLGTSKRRKT